MAAMTSLIAHLRRVAGAEWGLLRRHPKLRLSAAGVLLLPALYALIYLSSVWDPNAHTQALPVALVSEDAGMVYRGISVNVGNELLAALEAGKEFAYRRYPTAEAAREAVRKRDMIFALIVPADFSRHAAPGADTQRGRLIVYTSEGNSYTGAGIARRFAPEVAHQVNETLNERRWALVLDSSAGSVRTLDALRRNVGLLKAGAEQLAEGTQQAQKGMTRLAAGTAPALAGAAELAGSSTQLADAGAQLTEGMRRTAGSLRQMQARMPPEAEMRALRLGATSLSTGQAVMADAVEQLQGGAGRLAGGLGELRRSSEDSLFVGAEIARAAERLEGGANQLTEGLKQAAAQQEKLVAGSKQLETGVYRAMAGVAALGSGLSGLTGALPEDRRLDDFAFGMKEAARGAQTLQGGLRQVNDGATTLSASLAKLDEGAARLAGGLALLATTLPADSPALDGTANGLAAPAESVIEVVAPVANNGTGLAPNFVPMALWVGALMTCFLFHARKWPQGVADAPRLALWLGKLAVPAGLVLGQAAVMLVMMVLVFDVKVPNLPTFALTLGIASLSFLAIVFAMVKFLGDIGKVLAVLLLILQLSSAGALIPIELTNEFFQKISPYLPFTWVVRAFRATLFGAFDGDWVMPWAAVVLAGLVASMAGAFLGRYRFVEDAAYGPAIDID
jgi:putative membrane protein